MAPLSWRQRHHTLLQALLSRAPLAEPDFHMLFAAVSDRDPATHQQLFNDTLLKINKDLAYLQFELRACINQYDGMVYYGVVNNIVDEESKLGTKYSVPQIAFYKGLIVIVDGSEDSQSRVPSSIKNFSLSQKENTLDELIRDRWLSYTSTGKIGLGTRSFLDLRSWFRGNDIPSCVVCNEACIKASSCLNEGCNVRIHEYCLKKKFSQRKASRACSSCGTEWPCQDGEADGDDDVNEPGEDQVSSANRSSRKKRKRVKAELVEENNNAGPSMEVPRRILRSAKAEAVEAAQEASSAGASQPDRGSKRRKK
ncbi:non-structural maintenance of chromosomes element 1 homolog isoform X3 [Sorghum bicolor]|uniref:Non-structural maintenance of chromosomes element 1 homolog n=1 Tax=Sorghum bicolor TaxID=4558 RepID=A0A1Z5R517_SORBI|nr:non-structural maintenance of chromosomes element 1 homolog isoform X3 [Sorghum bicolor]OQU78649.1 hypothetical protein SORBI_3008G018800 [Sorghum bicolor]|eukprot:XP_021301334.1 non-structural maintenance of chromosomes element 1 homolog isoform X3 [Sorghum bicolor]